MVEIMIKRVTISKIVLIVFSGLLVLTVVAILIFQYM